MKEAQDYPKSEFVVPFADLRDIAKYAQHDSWRFCGYYKECHCGLDSLTDKLGLERVPLPSKGE